MGCCVSKPKDEFGPQRAQARGLAAKKSYAQAEKIYREVLLLQQQRQKLTLAHPDVLETMSNLADVLEQQNKTKEATDIRNTIRDRLVRQLPKQAAKKPLPNKPPAKKSLPKSPPSKKTPPKKNTAPKKN